MDVGLVQAARKLMDALATRDAAMDTVRDQRRALERLLTNRGFSPENDGGLDRAAAFIAAATADMEPSEDSQFKED